MAWDTLLKNEIIMSVRDKMLAPRKSERYEPQSATNVEKSAIRNSLLWSTFAVAGTLMKNTVVFILSSDTQVSSY